MTGKHSSRQQLLLAIFVLSGFAGLIYQSVWSHYLGLFLGHAAYAQALVLALFMGGMAIGAAWIAKVGTGWRNLLRGYAIVELVIGVFGLVFHTVFTGVVGFGYEVLIPAAGSAGMASLLKWLLAALLILPQRLARRALLHQQHRRRHRCTGQHFRVDSGSRSAGHIDQRRPAQLRGRRACMVACTLPGSVACAGVGAGGGR